MFNKATKSETKLKIALTGPSGSGKTYSALAIASGMGKKIAVVDTENNSAALYSDTFKFDVAAMSPPYLVSKYIKAIHFAIEAKYDVLVLDSLTHAWAGAGGLLDQKEQLDARGGNSFTNWSKITKDQENFKAAILAANIHIISTMRSKQEYILQMNDKGKQTPIKVGLAPIQRDGIEYEFTLVLDIGMNHTAAASKDRTGLFDSGIFTPSKDTGLLLMDWLKTKDAPPVVEQPKPEAKAAVPPQESEWDKVQIPPMTNIGVLDPLRPPEAVAVSN